MARRRTLSHDLNDRLGFRRSVIVLRYVWLWALFREVEKRDPHNIDEFADAFEVDRSAVYRWQQSLREAYEDADSPAWVLDRIEQRRRAGTLRQFGTARMVT